MQEDALLRNIQVFLVCKRICHGLKNKEPAQILNNKEGEFFVLLGPREFFWHQS